MEKLKIKGNSGCSLNIFEDNDNMLFVRKSCSKDYLKRLEKQYVKQLNDVYFLEKIQSIDSPYPVWDNNSLVMPYISGMSFIEFFECCTTDEIHNTINTIVDYIFKEIDKCKLEIVDKNIFINKIESVYNNIQKNHPQEWLNTHEFLENLGDNLMDFLSKNEICIPVGKCHGDLTFSNIIFTDSTLWFIDYLDSFIETPLQDIVKLRQDTQFKWSLLMSVDSYNDAHIRTVFNYLDYIIDTCFEECNWYKDNYKFLQTVNLLRILPYASHDVFNEVILMLKNLNQEKL